MISLIDNRVEAFEHFQKADFKALSCRDRRRKQEELNDINEDIYILSKIKESYVNARKRSIKSKIDFNLNLDDIVKALEANGKRCWITGIIFKKKPIGFFRNPYAPSLDRINSNKGYTPENTRIVAYCVNAAMNEWGVDILDHMLGHYKAWGEERFDSYSNLKMSLACYDNWKKRRSA